MRDISIIKLFQYTLSFLFIIGVIIAFFILGIGYEELLNNIDQSRLQSNPQSEVLTLLQPFYSSSVICLTAFAGIAFLLIWKHNALEVERNAIIKKYNSDYLQGTDRGMLWLAAAMLCWEVSNTLHLYRLTFDLDNHLISKSVYTFIFEVISTLNSAFFILGVSTFNFDKIPDWYNHRLIRIFREKSKYKNIAFVSLIVIAATFLLPFVSPKLVDLPDYIMSFFTSILLFLYFKGIFEDRKITSLVWLVYVTLILTMFAQSLEPIEFFWEGEELKISPYFIYIKYFIKLTYIFFLTILFSALAYSYRGFLEKRAREKQNAELISTSQELVKSQETVRKNMEKLVKAGEEKERLRREMNHTIRGNIDFLKEKLEMLEEDTAENSRETPQNELFLIKEVKSKLKIVGHIHNRLHEDSQYNYPNLKAFLQDFENDIQELYDIKDTNYSYQINISDDFKVRTKHARNIASIIVELSLNTYKVYLRQRYKTDDRWLNISITEDVENDFLNIVIEDQGPGFAKNTPWNFGLTTLHEIIEKDLGGIIKRDFRYQKGTRWLIYVPISKIKS